MEKIIRIDLGTTYSCLAYSERKEPEVIPNLHDLSIKFYVVEFTCNFK